MKSNNKTILVVEDDFVASILYKIILESLGYEMLGPVASVKEALALSEEQAFCAALLDVNLDGETVTPVSERLSESGCPYIFISGYSDLQMLPKKYHDCEFLEKPVKETELKDALVAIGLTDFA